MDDISKRNLPTRELHLINNVCLYLCVTTLSEISNHTGTHVLQQYLHTPNLEQLLSHTYPHIGSTLKWPTQTLPGPKSWKLWSNTVQRLYCHTSSTKLLQPMGVWMHETYDTNWTWTWYLCTSSISLYQRNNKQWHEYTPTLTRRTYALYSSQPNHARSVLPAYTTPVTPTFTDRGMRIDLPAAHIHQTITPLPAQPNLRIDQRITLPPTQWEEKLWAPIQIQTRLPDLYQHITSGRIITISSDAAMNPNRDSCFAWLIATDKPIWQGEGAIPRPVEDAHTGRSEAYGLLTALCFLAHYLQHFPMTYHLTRTLTAYCDNSGTVTRISTLLQEKPRLTRSTILDDYDVYAEIVQATRSIHPLRVQFIHIKGHQDKATPIHKLTKPAQYNINCDKRAADGLPSLARYSTSCPTHPMPSSYPHLTIHRKVIVRDLQGALRHAAVTPTYRSYLQQKFHWTATDAEEVNWNALTMAMKHFPKDHSRISKIIHEWLPLHGSFSKEATPATMCPQCNQSHEDTWHFLECTAPERRKLFNQLHHDLQTLHTTYQIDPHLFQLLWQGLLSIRMDTDISDQLPDYPMQYSTLFE